LSNYCKWCIITIEINFYGENMSILERIGTTLKLLGHEITLEYITGFTTDDNLQALSDGEANKIYVKTKTVVGDIPESVQVSHIIHEILESINMKIDGYFFGEEGDQKEQRISILAEVITQLLYDNFNDTPLQEETM